MNAKFSIPAILIVLLGGVFAYMLTLLLQSRGFFSPSHDYGDDIGASTYSVSCVGYAGLYEILSKSGPGAVRLLLNEPHQNSPEDLYVLTSSMPAAASATDADNALLILPKWLYLPNMSKRKWVIDQSLMNEDLVNELALFVTGEFLDVRRSPQPESFEMSAALPSAPTPPLPEVQLMNHPDVKPIIYTEQGVLFGLLSVEGQNFYILSDPDLANNLGLSKGDNPRFIVDIIEYVYEDSGAGGPIIFSEPFFPYVDKKPSSAVVPSMLRFPMIIVTILVAVSAILLLLACWRRFGGLDLEPSSVDFGKAKLIENSARLLARSGHMEPIVDGYVELTIRSAAKSLHAPRTLDRRQSIDWLANASASKGARDLRRILSEVSSAKLEKSPVNLLKCALTIHKWKEEIESGPTTNSRHRQEH
ncbi:MAG: hypothetical protein LBT62_08640 [Deltaproteobacteria bacterium]|jgi:hypothetical protein|nr:hypothetical protein [Deltaproteobacteria bacterium]